MRSLEKLVEDPLKSIVRLGEYAGLESLDADDGEGGPCCFQGVVPGGDNDCGTIFLTTECPIRKVREKNKRQKKKKKPKLKLKLNLILVNSSILRQAKRYKSINYVEHTSAHSSTLLRSISVFGEQPQAHTSDSITFRLGLVDRLFDFAQQIL